MSRYCLLEESSAGCSCSCDAQCALVIFACVRPLLTCLLQVGGDKKNPPKDAKDLMGGESSFLSKFSAGSSAILQGMPTALGKIMGTKKKEDAPVDPGSYVPPSIPGSGSGAYGKLEEEHDGAGLLQHASTASEAAAPLRAPSPEVPFSPSFHPGMRTQCHKAPQSGENDEVPGAGGRSCRVLSAAAAVLPVPESNDALTWCCSSEVSFLQRRERVPDSLSSSLGRHLLGVVLRLPQSLRLQAGQPSLILVCP